MTVAVERTVLVQQMKSTRRCMMVVVELVAEMVLVAEEVVELVAEVVVEEVVVLVAEVVQVRVVVQVSMAKESLEVAPLEVQLEVEGSMVEVVEEEVVLVVELLVEGVPLGVEVVEEAF